MCANISKYALRAKQLLYFSEAVRCGSISRAADENAVQQPNFSTQITNLEKTVQKKLIDRYSKGVGLTEEGEAYYKIATAIKNLIISSENVSSPDDKMFGDIKLWTSDGLASIYLAGCFEKFYQKYPNVNLDINCSIEMPELHEFDMALLFHKPNTKSLRLVSEHNLSFSLFASENYIAKFGYPKDKNDLKQNHKLCANLVNSTMWKTWHTVVNKAKFTTTINNGSGVLLNLVKAGVGIGLIPINVASKEQNLIEIKNIIPVLKTKFYLVAKKSSLQNKKINALTDIINFETTKQEM